MDAVFYWDMTYAEIAAAIEAHQKQMEAQAKIQASIAYRQADLIASMVSKVLGGTHNVPALHEVFPGLFEAPQATQQNWKVMKDRIAAIVEAQGKRGEKRGDNH